MSDLHDVVIAGYGPVGAMLALLLQEKGVRALVIDRDNEVQQFPRAAHFDDEVIRVLQTVGLSHLADRMENPPRYQYFDTNWKPFLARLFPAGISDQSYKHDFMFFQPDVERAMRAKLTTSWVAPTLLLGHEILDVKQDATGVDVRVQNLTTGEVTTYRSQYLVGCDGASSVVRKSMATTFEQLSESHSWYVVDIELTSDEDPGADQWEFCDPDRIVTYVPLSGPYRRFEFDVKPEESQEELSSPERTWSLLNRWVAPTNARILRNDIYRFHSLLADRWRDGRLFIAGDAAHLMTPKLGQGLCTGIRDVDNLAWKLARVLQGDAEPTLLDTYGSERMPPARQYIEISAHMVSLIVQKASGLDSDREVVEEIIAGRQRLGNDAIREADGFVGTLSRQPVVADGRRLDDLIGYRFALLTTVELEESMSSSDRANLIALDAVILRGDDPAVGDYLRDVDRCALLIRPDRYVAGSASDSVELSAALLAARHNFAKERPLLDSQLGMSSRGGHSLRGNRS